MKFLSVRILYGPVRILCGPVRLLYGPVRILNGPIFFFKHTCGGQGGGLNFVFKALRAAISEIS